MLAISSGGVPVAAEIASALALPLDAARRIKTPESRGFMSSLTQSPVHFEDVASAFVLVLERHISCAVLDINDEPIRQRDYLMRLASIVNAPAPGEAAGAMPPSQRCSTAKAQETLGWHPAVGIWPTDQQGVNTCVRIWMGFTLNPHVAVLL